MRETEVRVVLADALVIGPNDRLVIHIAEKDVPPDRAEQLEWLDAWESELERHGLKDRAFTIVGDVELRKVEAATG